MNEKIYQMINPQAFPTPFCPGCGHGILMNAVLRAFAELEYDLKQTLFVSGIGCAAWIPSPHFKADTLHTLHGRAIAYATGAKLFNPRLKVMVISGDGDLSSIGGNHLIHGARTGGNPTSALLRDAPMLVNGALWLAAVLVIIS